MMPLTSCTIVMAPDAGALVERAAQTVAGTVRRWGGPTLLVVRAKDLPAGRCLVFTTDPARGLPADEHGFAIVPEGEKVFIASRSPRGLYNAAIYLCDFLIDGPARSLMLNATPLQRAPAMPGRPAYALTIWGNEAEYTAADWENIFESFARDGMDRVYFWASGHFPSAKFPQTYKYATPYDTTAKSRIGTVEDLQAIIRHAHDWGLKLYLGGGLGGWCGTGRITNLKAGTMKTGTQQAAASLCPSHPESRTALLEYYTEMFDALPEADGLYIELAEEFGECRCELCAKPLDEVGSKQYGRSVLTLAREIAEQNLKRHPRAKFAYTVGYDEHAKDPEFYRLLHDMGDEHYEWMEARQRWEFTGPGGKNRPAAQFSKRIMKWGQWYNQPLDNMVATANRAASAEFYGLITSFEPGFASGSFYKQIPYPTGLLPYALTGFAFRELTWEPTLSLDGLKKRAGARFFGADAPASLTEDLWELREIIRTSGRKTTREQLAKIEADIAKSAPTAGPKTREGLELMRTAVADIRTHLKAFAP